jgi:hypothetical protein
MSTYNKYCSKSIEEFQKKTGIEMTPDHQNIYRVAYNEAAETWHNIGKDEGWDEHTIQLRELLLTSSELNARRGA